MKLNQKGVFDALIPLIITLVVVTAGFVAYRVFWAESDESTDKTGQSEMSETSGDADQEARDNARRQHAITIANALFASTLSGKIPVNQASLDQLQDAGEATELSDPLTNEKYIFNSNQEQMAVGEAKFAYNSTCDNKIIGSDGEGLIIDADFEAIAVAIKLESGGYACEASL